MAHDLVSLITVLDGLHYSTDQEYRIPNLESLLEKATFLKKLLEKFVKQHRSRGTISSNKEIIEALQSEIRDAANEAEDIIESHSVDQMLAESDSSRFLISAPDHLMSKMIEKFDAVTDKLIQMIKDNQSHDEERMDVIINPTLPVATDPTSSELNIAMVGFDDDALHLKDRLTSGRRERMIIPIVGMGGIGKTTLARNLYNDPLIVSHFDARAWVTISQDYNVRVILLGLLGCVFRKISEDMLRQTDSELGLTLYQELCGRRYLVVLDDIWSQKAWDEIQRYFPTEKNRSRILITSRELDVAKYPDSACEEHQMHLLSSAQGWDLLRQKVFDAKKEERCPPFLEEVGRKIASDCGGLPLAISVIGGLLSENKYSKDSWEQVAKDVRSVVSHDDEHFSKILSLSYDNLPLHLKPCFLYMAAFPEDFKVRGSRLVKLWVAEGFLWRSSGNDKRVEDVAEEYLKALVDRNLLSVAGKKSNGRAESYSMHDLLRDLCVTKAGEEKFLYVFKNGTKQHDLGFNSFRRVSTHLFTKDTPALADQLSHSRSLLWNPRTILPVAGRFYTMRLARVLDLYDIFFYEFPTEILQLVNLRFLAIRFKGKLPSRMWRMQNLQTLIMESSHYLLRLPHEAWEIPGLRHLKVKISTIFIDYKITRAHENLQTIYGVRLNKFLVSNLINSMPNLRKLAVHDELFAFSGTGSIIDLSHLHQLETLKLREVSAAALSRIALPTCLKKVCLFRCMIPMTLVNAVGALRNVEMLKIDRGKFLSEEEEEDLEEEEEDEEEWEVSEGVEFCSLQYLELSQLTLVRWKADRYNFPRLRYLRIKQCKHLEEIPTSIGEISTLEKIEVDEDNPSLVSWAKEIQETQRYETGSEESLQVVINRIYY